MPDQFATTHDNSGDQQPCEFAAAQDVQITARQVAHDCNNLLGIISACAYILEEEALSTTAKESISDITDAAGRAAELMRRLLAVSRQTVPNESVLDISGRLNALQRLLRRIAGPKINLTVYFDCNLLSRINEVQFDQILINLVTNAQAATRDGGAIHVSAEVAREYEIRTCTEGWLQAGDYVRLTVSDNGSGMAPEVMARIFEPFYTTRATAGGTGVGLSTVQHIVRQHGGAIDVNSAPSAGTTFQIYLPAMAAAADDILRAA